MSDAVRLDSELTRRGLVASRSQAESYIKLGQVQVNGRAVTKAGTAVSANDDIRVLAETQYVSRAALKLSSVAAVLGLDFADKLVLDVGSSTGGFTEYALSRGARGVIAVELGTDQLHPRLRTDPRIELHEQTDIRRFVPAQLAGRTLGLVVADVSFISLRELLPHIATLCTPQTDIAVMVKPQFEAAASDVKHKGVIKNDKMRREILKSFETWAASRFRIVDKADSQVSGRNGNVERFYLLRLLPNR